MPEQDTASGAAAPDATTQPEPEKKPPRKFVSADDVPAAGEQQTADEPNATVAADTAADKVEAGDGGDDGEKPAPGTPDKALQKVQQDVASLTRLIEGLAGTGEEPDPEQLQKLKQRRERAIQSLRDAGMDEAADELAEAQQKLVQLDESQAVTQEMATRLEKLEADNAWVRAEIKYPHTDVRKVWEKAVEDADARVKKKFAGVWEEMSPRAQHQALHGEANELYESRCSAVEAKAANRPAAAVAGKGQAVVPAATTRTTTTAVGAGEAATPSREQQALQRARRLVHQED